jgi:plasmid maintenance system antidote protein VapI
VLPPVSLIFSPQQKAHDLISSSRGLHPNALLKLYDDAGLRPEVWAVLQQQQQQQARIWREVVIPNIRG